MDGGRIFLSDPIESAGYDENVLNLPLLFPLVVAVINGGCGGYGGGTRKLKPCKRLESLLPPPTL